LNCVHLDVADARRLGEKSVLFTNAYYPLFDHLTR
jgi:hypothetical protein